MACGLEDDRHDTTTLIIMKLFVATIVVFNLFFVYHYHEVHVAGASEPKVEENYEDF